MSLSRWIVGLAAAGIAGHALYRRALARNPVAVLDAADLALTLAKQGGQSGVERVARARYGPDPHQQLEVFAPPGTPRNARLPVVVFIHGGAWNSGRPQDYRFIARSLIAATAPQGCMVVLAGYRLLPQGRWPVMLADGARALRWVADHAATLGGDPQRVVLMGHSAGAYNALALALDKRWLADEGLDADALAGAIGLATPADFLPLDDPASIATFGHCGDLAQTQPINHVHAGAPPLLLVHGADDPRVRPRNSLALAAAMTAAGQPTQALVLDGVDHERLIMAFAKPFARETRPLEAVAAFIAKVCASPPVHSAPQ
ncbi:MULTISPECIES: alpha/beta hydrolase [unclassified Novosphingobium]|uniref:alpha/beta hydrolase n=1 Tax=unclassified Novosphingobium TaxID=2644732 RepID=UPI00146A3A5A|nr:MULTISPECIES: alpha/beta hydrolase [unclassified Novosphingobium]NMN88014.1 acetyl esterase/lipase [Novosphingobium sp. SG916]